MVMKVSIIIVNWNGAGYLPDCLESLSRQSFRDFETILVDNGSEDESVSLVRESYPWVRLVELETNTGYAGGNNAGLNVAGGEYIVLLNNDTRAESEWLELLVKAAEEHPAAGMVASRTCVFGQPDVIDTLGGKVCRDGMSRGAFRGRRFSELGFGPIVDVLYPSPTAALYRRSMIDEVGFFDEDFFAYAEDTDLGLRARWHGWDAVAATGAIVHHRYSGTGGTFSPFKLYLVERNHHFVAIKNFPLSWLLLAPLFMVGRYWEQAWAILTGEGSGSEFRSSGRRGELTGAIVRAHLHAARKLPAMLRKRRQLMKRRKISPTQMTRMLKSHRLTFRELLDRGEEQYSPQK